MSLRVLSQTALAATTDTDLLSGAQSAPTVVTCVSVCNRASTTAAFRLWVKVQGSTTATKQYEFYDYPIMGNDAPKFTWGVEGLGIQPGDVLSARSDNANLTVTVHGRS